MIEYFSSFSKRASGAGDEVRPDTWTRRAARKVTVGRDLMRIHGPTKFLGRIVPWTFRRRYFLYEGSPARRLPGHEASLRVRPALARADDLPLILSARPGFYDLRQLNKRLASGHACFVAWLGLEPVGIRWAFIGSVYLPYLSRTLVLAPDEVYFDEVFTVSRYRRRGVDDQNFRFMNSWFRGQGFRKEFCFLTSWDTYLHRRYESLGMKRVGEFVRLGGLGKGKVHLEGRLQDLGLGRISPVRNGGA